MIKKTCKILPSLDPAKLSRQKYSMLFETGYVDKDNNKTYYFSKPLAILRAYDYAGLQKAFEKIENYSKKYYIAGYLSYEAGYYFEKDIFKPEEKSKEPLLEFFVYKNVSCFDHLTGKITGKFPLLRGRIVNLSCSVKNIKADVSRAEYHENIEKIKKYIQSGDTYQVNYTSRIKFDFSGDSCSFYETLKKKQSASYSAYLNLGRRKILSLSPELFLNVNGATVFSKPMKGTIRRGRTAGEDFEMKKALKNSVKNRAENIMIVDMIRNDLGRISRTGSVKTSKIFEIEKYNTLFQMVTTVSGKLLPGLTYFDIFKSLFPGGSITGAPKIRTMELIKSLEREKRRVYCGALGIIFPGSKKAVFNIPIRTVLLEGNKGEMGVGGGVVWDSSPEGEYREALLKAKFLTDKLAEFSLLETILWDKDYFLLPGHLKRLKASAEYFSFPLDLGRIKKELKKKAGSFTKGLRYRLRLLISKNNTFKIEALKIAKEQEKNRVIISSVRTNSKDRYLYHKTTNRALYDSERKKLKADVLDVIFLNEKEEVTEGAITNVFILKNGRYYTPPVSSGLLPGVFRAYYIKKTGAVEKPLYLADLKSADKIILTNSVKSANAVILSRS